MNSKIDWDFLFSDTRARVYLLWAVLAAGGFIVTHFYQRQQINGLWFLVSLVGLGYMYRVMPLRIKQMRNIFLAWLIPIVVGLAVSGFVFRFSSSLAAALIANLGAFWLMVMAAGYFLNGLVDKPSTWYWFAAALNFIAGLFCFTVDSFTSAQYLVAAIVSAWSMLNLWLLRT